MRTLSRRERLRVEMDTNTVNKDMRFLSHFIMWGWDKDIILSLLVSTFPLTYLSEYYEERGRSMHQKCSTVRGKSRYGPSGLCDGDILL